jgi:hypothetical protein
MHGIHRQQARRDGLPTAGPRNDLVGDERKQPALPQSAPRLEHAANNHVGAKKKQFLCLRLSAERVLLHSHWTGDMYLQLVYKDTYMPQTTLCLPPGLVTSTNASRLAIFIARHRHHRSSSPRPCSRRCIPERLV